MDQLMSIDFTSPFWGGLIRSLLIVFLGFPLIYFLSRWLRKLTRDRFSPHRSMIISRFLLYTGIIILVITIMNEMGFSLAPLLGAAGIVGIAIGFASQTSVSNIISGLFLITEEPFALGDVIRIGSVTGEVLSIDLLSVKIRQFDNSFVRIPNETVIKSEVTNLTRFPIRRLDVAVSVAYKEQIERVRRALLEVARENEVALREPEPLIIFTGFGASSIDLQFSVWVERANYLTLKNTLQEEVKNRFDQEGVEIPFPHISLYSGEATKPFPVEVVRRES